MSLFNPKTVTLRDGAQVLLRSPEPDDAKTLLGYLDAVRREAKGIMFDPEDEMMDEQGEREWIKSHNDNKHAVLLAGIADGEFISLCGVHATKFIRQRHTAGIGISIRERWCGRGLGTILMREMIGWATEKTDLQQLTLNVFSTNPRAQAVYRKVGFVVDGRLPRRAKIDGGYLDFIEMSLWLDDVRATS